VISQAVTHFFRRRGFIVVMVLAILSVYGLEAQARREVIVTPANQSDQAAYLAFAQQMHDSGYTVIGRRNRMPVFPFLLSLIYRPGLSETQFLTRAQSFNINLSILILLLLFLIFRKFFPTFYALALLVMTTFGVFIYRSGVVQTEVLFYFLSFCSFLLLVRMLTAARWWLAILSGATTGIAHLTKASVLPALALWAAVFLGQIFWNSHARPNTGWHDILRRLGLLLLVIGVFGAVIFPYIRTSKQIFGHYFYNVNSTFYMWCDSWPEAVAFTKAYDNSAGGRNFPPDQVPSPARYWREHSAAQIAERFGHGLKTLATRSAKATGYYKFVLLFVLTAAGLAWRQRQRACRLIAEKPFAAIFCALFFFCYVLLFAWYDAIVTDSRFILSLFLPFVFVASMFLLGLGKDRTFAIAGRRISFTELFAGCLGCLALTDVAYNALRICRLMG
jgi:4-amino-4-deoxy-L-arabinose transferase-like glycosyltransferase